MIPLEAAQTRDGLIYLCVGIGSMAIGALLFVSTVTTYLGQSEVRGLLQRAATGDTSTRGELQTLAQDHPENFLYSQALGTILLDASDTEPDFAEAAESVFANAAKAAQASADTTQLTYAMVGLVAARLRKAERLDGSDRADAVAEAASLLEGSGVIAEHPDVVALKAGIAILQGNPQAALDATQNQPHRAISLDGLGAHYWHRACAMLMLHKLDSLDDVFLAYQTRRRKLSEEDRPQELEEGKADPRSDPAKLLTLAYQLTMADERMSPQDPEVLRRMVDLAHSAATHRFHYGLQDGISGRFLPTRRELPEALNAIAIGYYRTEQWEAAYELFKEVSAMLRGQEPLYLHNMAVAAYRAGQANASDRGPQHMKQALKHLFTEIDILDDQEPLDVEALVAAGHNYAAISIETRDQRQGANYYSDLEEEHPNPAEWNRNLGALLDYNNEIKCVQYYERAIELGHPDAQAMARRIEVYRNR